MGFFQDERHIVFAVFGCQCLSCGNINFIVTDVFPLFVLSVISHQGLTFTDINIVVNLGQVFRAQTHAFRKICLESHFTEFSVFSFNLIFFTFPTAFLSALAIKSRQFFVFQCRLRKELCWCSND